MYIDCNLDTSFTGTISPINYLCGAKIGAIAPNAEYFNGKLDDYAIWNRALTPQEILQVCKAVSIEVEIPNVFTPNADGINDVLEITNLKRDDKVEIYNRWGTLVFETEYEKAFWDGFTTSGEPCSIGVYYYVVILESGEAKKGFVQLLK